MRSRYLVAPAIVALLFVRSTVLSAQSAQSNPPPLPSAQSSDSDIQALWNAYQLAVYDSSVYQRWNIRPLRPLTADEHGQVLVATLTSRDGKIGETIAAGSHGMWVTGVPEVQTLCRAFRGDVVMQLRELLGLPPNAAAPRFLVLRARIEDLFRPSPDGDVHTRFPCQSLPDAAPASDCGNAFPQNTSAAHYQWMAEEVFYLHAIPNGYPWTHLGYTYDWTPRADRYGASEYVIRANAQALIVANMTPLEYCSPATH